MNNKERLARLKKRYEAWLDAEYQKHLSLEERKQSFRDFVNLEIDGRIIYTNNHITQVKKSLK